MREIWKSLLFKENPLFENSFLIVSEIQQIGCKNESDF